MKIRKVLRVEAKLPVCQAKNRDDLGATFTKSVEDVISNEGQIFQLFVEEFSNPDMYWIACIIVKNKIGNPIDQTLNDPSNIDRWLRERGCAIKNLLAGYESVKVVLVTHIQIKEKL